MRIKVCELYVYIGLPNGDNEKTNQGYFSPIIQDYDYIRTWT